MQGTYELIQKQGNFSEVTGASTSDSIITDDAVMEIAVFTGAVNTGKFVNGCTLVSYTGYDFNNSWNICSSGIHNKTDGTPVGAFSVNYPVGTGANTNFNIVNPSNAIKAQWFWASTNLFRFSTSELNNRITYLGKK